MIDIFAFPQKNFPNNYNLTKILGCFLPMSREELIVNTVDKLRGVLAFSADFLHLFQIQ